MIYIWCILYVKIIVLIVKNMEKGEYKIFCKILVIRVWLEEEQLRKEEKERLTKQEKNFSMFLCKLRVGGFKMEIVISYIDCYEYF